MTVVDEAKTTLAFLCQGRLIASVELVKYILASPPRRGLSSSSRSLRKDVVSTHQEHLSIVHVGEVFQELLLTNVSLPKQQCSVDHNIRESIATSCTVVIGPSSGTLILRLLTRLCSLTLRRAFPGGFSAAGVAAVFKICSCSDGFEVMTDSLSTTGNN